MTHQLYLVRHAIAVKHGTEGIVEEERPLTAEGRERMRQGVQGMKRIKVEPEVILSSPLVRAVQTAEILQNILSDKKDELIPVEIEKTLLPGADLDDFLKKLKGRVEARVMLVGHEPSMSSWVQSLLSCDPPGSIRLKKGSLCHLELTWVGSRPFAELVALLQPRVLRLVG